MSRQLAWARDLVIPAGIWLVVCAVGAVALGWTQQNSREVLVQRFDTRISLGSKFVASYVDDAITRERAQATRYLAGATVSDADFGRSVAAFGYPSAVLLDSGGRLIRAYPARDDLVGTDLAREYAHLRFAVEQNEPAVSGVVPSASRRVPVTAFSVPFETPYGRRVFSGAIEVARSPLSDYLTNALTVAGNSVYLVDATGRTVAANHARATAAGTLAASAPDLAAAAGGAARVHDSGVYTAGAREWYHTSYPVEGTSWRLVATVPAESLYAPLAGAAVGGRVGLVTAAAVGMVAVFAATRGSRSRRELRLSEQRFRTVFDRSLVGMAIADTSGRFVQVNGAVCDLLGYTPEALLERTVTDVTHSDDLDESLAGMRRTLAGDAPGFSLEKRYRRADGGVVHGAATITLLRGADRQPQRFALQIVDISDRKRLEAEEARAQSNLAEHAVELERMNGDLTAARDRMGDFVAMLSHDVRQPITGILGYAETLSDDWDELPEARRHQYLLSIASAGRRLNQLVEDILTVAQLDAGALTPRPVDVPLDAALREAIGVLPPDQALDVVVTGADRLRARVDPGHLQQLVGNLLGNAVKYGAPPFDVRAHQVGDRVELAICDHGEGVPADFVAHLFDRFSRAETGVATTKRGTGLGLYIVRTLADAGGIGLSYLPNRPTGACFLLDLPAAHSWAPTVGRRGDPGKTLSVESFNPHEVGR